ncbi:ankyrin repeat-containing domain protein [Aspergillus heterothallicus]
MAPPAPSTHHTHPLTMSLFINLPNDILLLIAEAIDSERDLAALTQTSRYLHTLLCDLLYKTNIRHSHSSALFWAARTGQLATAQRLLALGADVEETQNHCTPLEAAACAGQEAMVRFLLHRGANYGFWRCRPWTPLCAAAVEGHAGVVRILLERELPPPEKVVEDGSSGGARFICRNKQDTLVKAMFLKDPSAGQDPRVEYSIALFMSIASSEDEVCNVLIESGKADLDYRDGGQRTALEWAYSHRRYRTIAALLRNGADANIAGRRSRTVLHDAASAGNEEVVRILLANATTDLNCRDVDNATPLLIAVRAQHGAVVELLLQRGEDVDVNCRDNSHLTPLGAALADCNMQIAKLLVQHPSIDLNSVDEHGQGPLFAAALHDNLEMLTLLLDAGARPNKTTTPNGLTPLMQAVRSGNKKVSLRLALGDLSLLKDQDANGWTPLFFAAANADWELTKLLIHLGADPFHLDAAGETILLAVIKTTRYASRGTNEERTIRLLLNKGINPNVQDKHKRTALSYAVEYRNGPAMAALLDSPHKPGGRGGGGVDSDSCGNPIKLWARSKTEEQLRELGFKSFIPSAWLVGNGIDVGLPGASTAAESHERTRLRYNEERRRVYKSRVAGAGAVVEYTT